jgi:hypothetical protein
MFLNVKFFPILVDPINAIASTAELAGGVSIAHEGLAVPPPRFPTPAGLGTKPSPVGVAGAGKSWN